MAREGAKLALLDIDAVALERSRAAIVAEVPAAEVLTVTADVAQEAEVRDCVEQTVSHFGRIDGQYNNAGIEGEQNPVEAYTSDGLDRVLSINLKGVFYGMKHALPHFKAQGSGAIVNAASVGGRCRISSVTGRPSTRWRE